MSVSDALGRIDWNFPRSGTDVRSVHSSHWFPGNFIPQIPTAFIEILSKPNDLVFDPFSGSGTTAIEAARLGRKAIMSDRISACVMIGRGKLVMETAGLDRHVRSEILANCTWHQRCRSDLLGKNGEGSDPSLSRWFTGETLSQLRYLWQVVEQQSVDSSRHILMLLFSDVLFACASPGVAVTSSGKRRRHHWGWVADNVYPRQPVEHDAIALMEERLLSVPNRGSTCAASRVLVTQQDARCLALLPNSVDLVVTSPPYVGMIDYARANRLLYAWMGWSLDTERETEIGARFKRRRLQGFIEYLEDMRLCWSELHRVLRPGGYCAVVIGESRPFRGAVDQTMHQLSNLMPRLWGPIARSPSRRRVSERGGTDSVEYLHVFRKT